MSFEGMNLEHRLSRLERDMALYIQALADLVRTVNRCTEKLERLKPPEPEK